MTPLTLTGLRGNNPLGFLATLGVLTVLDRTTSNARLQWTTSLAPRPTITGAESIDHLIEVLLADLDTWRTGPLLSWPPDRPHGDLKITPTDYHQWATHLWDQAANQPEQAELFNALLCWGGHARDGRMKPTHLHFTAGQQQFLAMARTLTEQLTPEHLHEALTGTQTHPSPLPSFAWEARGQRLYAYRATNPSTDKRTSTPGANWLAFLGLTLLPITAKNGTPYTTGCDHNWLRSNFRWPIWTPPLDRRTTRSLLTDPTLTAENPNAHQHHPDILQRRGIHAIYQATIHRSDHGYGHFTAPTTLATT